MYLSRIFSQKTLVYSCTDDFPCDDWMYRKQNLDLSNHSYSAKKLSSQNRAYVVSV